MANRRAARLRGGGSFLLYTARQASGRRARFPRTGFLQAASAAHAVFSGSTARFAAEKSVRRPRSVVKNLIIVRKKSII